ncbi:MAG: zinc-binding protein [Desulfobacteraceae bacterium]|nr:MAG: zinc-binding protein [Desulfobacteraceae bacterium]
MSANCCTGDGNVMILACSGASNVGQLSNQAAVELTREGFGKMFCLAGIGGHLSGFVQSAKDVPRMVAVDGCSVGCAKAILEQARVPMQHYLVLTDEGIEKNKDFNLQRADVERVKAAIKRTLNEKSLSAGAGAAACGCGCK